MSRVQFLLGLAPVLLWGVIALAAGIETMIDQGTIIRATQVRDHPDTIGQVLGELPANTPVGIYERYRLWVRVKPLDPAVPQTGWARLIDLRLGGAQAGGAAPAPAAGGFAGFSRSVSGLLSGFRSRPGNYNSSTTSTIGIRGLTTAELESSAPNYAAYAEIERYTAPPEQAVGFAQAAGLVPQRIGYVTPPAAPAGGQP